MLAHQFQDKGVIVTGEMSQAAQAVILLAAEQGASVLFSVRPGSEALSRQLLSRAQTLGIAERIFCATVDLSSESEIEQFMDGSVERLPGFHVLIHDLDTAEAPHKRALLDTSLAEWNQVLREQLRTPFLVARRAIAEFLAGGEGGRIVYLTRASGPNCAGDVSFLAAQSALTALIRSLAKEYGRRNISCNAVSIEMDSRAAGQSKILPGAGAYSQVAQAALFLASDEASYINGAIIPATCSANISKAAESKA